jgi:hypothetical protein
MDVDSKILIAAISAGSAIAGAAITQIVGVFLAHFERRHKKKILLREKYEELALLIHESNSWLSEQMNAKSLSELRSGYPEKARKATVLAHIYFPKLRDVCESYVNACAKFNIVLIDNHEFNPNHDVGTQAAHSNPEALEAAAQNARVCRQNIEDKVVRFASSYAKA